jgi:hypothetical protein
MHASANPPISGKNLFPGLSAPVTFWKGRAGSASSGKGTDPAVIAGLSNLPESIGRYGLRVGFAPAPPAAAFLLFIFRPISPNHSLARTP